MLGKTQLELNTLGDVESRSRYRDALVEYLEKHLDALSAESRERLTRNPLRILDSKDEGDRRVIADAPIFTAFLNAESSAFFNDLQSGLKDLGIEYILNPRLVRGLDYYCHTAFEFTTTDLGAQGAVIAGGRYDGLIGMMGGQQTPGVGWAGGIERLSMLTDDTPSAPRPVAIVPIGAEPREAAFKMAETLRRDGYRIDLGYSGNLSKRMKRANKLGACAAVLLGEDELARNEATVRHMDSGEQDSVSLDSLSEALSRYKQT